jgi:hypothetical protein
MISYNTYVPVENSILYLDAANTRSYPGSGTTWTDLSGTGNNSTLTNGPTFSTSNRGTILLDGTNDYVALPYLFFSHDAGTPFSISIWFKTATSGILLGQTGSGYVPAIYTDTNGKIRTSCFWGGSTGNQSVSTATVTDNIWHNITVTFASTSHKSYLDGILFATLGKNQTSYGNNYSYYIGYGSWASWTNAGANAYFTGSVGSFNFWTRELSSTEVLQNFNAHRGRYGV